MGLSSTTTTCVKNAGIRSSKRSGKSKSAEGFTARVTFTRAREEGMRVDVHWQDADSSSSNAVSEVFPMPRS